MDASLGVVQAGVSGGDYSKFLIIIKNILLDQDGNFGDRSGYNVTIH